MLEVIDNLFIRGWRCLCDISSNIGADNFPAHKVQPGSLFIKLDVIFFIFNSLSALCQFCRLCLDSTWAQNWNNFHNVEKYVTILIFVHACLSMLRLLRSIRLILIDYTWEKTIFQSITLNKFFYKMCRYSF